MADVVTSREAIAIDAEACAKWWAHNPQKPRPTNPYCEHMEPAHFREWNASFERSLVKHSAPESEASA